MLKLANMLNAEFYIVSLNKGIKQMTIKKMIEELEKMAEEVGDDAEVPVMTTYGENDYVIPKYGVIAELEDQDGNTFKCALIGSEGGSELSEQGIAHYKWNPSKSKVNRG